MIDIAFFYVDYGGEQYRQLIANMIASARAVMPSARFVHLTDKRSEPAEGADIFARLDHEVQRSELCVYRVAMQALYMEKADRPVVFVDPDIEFRRSVEGVFDGSFSVGVVKFADKHAMPFNTGLLYAMPQARPFFDEWKRVGEGLPQAVWGWWNDQISLAAMVGVDAQIGETVTRCGVPVRIFDALDHAPMPKENSGDPYAVHYKGLAKGAFGATEIAKDVPATREQGGFLWPVEDSACSVSSFREIENLELALSMVTDFTACVQAGGNCGVWPKRLGEKFGTVYTFEPEPRNFYCLNQNVPECHVVKLPCALGHKPGRIALAGAVANCGAYRVDGPGVVPMMRIDDLNLDRCGLIYLDIEGFEPFALAGGIETIRRCRPVVAFEDKGHWRGYGQELDSPHRLMAELGYEEVGRIGKDVVMRYRAEQRVAAE